MSITAAGPKAGVQPPGNGLRRRLRNASLAAVLALALAPPAHAQVPAEPTFEVQRFSVEGNTLLDPVQIDAALAAHLGSVRSFADLQAAVAALQSAYARAGFGAVRTYLPEQQVARARCGSR